jgi:hypothetical protein
MFDRLKITGKIVGQLWLFAVTCIQLILSLFHILQLFIPVSRKICFSKVLGIREPKEKLVKDINIASSIDNLKTQNVTPASSISIDKMQVISGNIDAVDIGGHLNPTIVPKTLFISNSG